MKPVFVVAAILLAGVLPVVAQDYQGTFPPNSAGQNVGGVRADAWTLNTSSAGFGASSFRTIVGAGTNQATATVIPTSSVKITACPAGAGVVLPNLERYATITVINRSGTACNVYPTPGGTVETSPGTVGAVNAPAVVGGNADATYRLAGPTEWLQ
jgi:hypothetical protein